MSNSQPNSAPAPHGAEPDVSGDVATSRSLTDQLRQLVGMLGAVASAIDEAGEAGLTAEERELVDAILLDARQTIVAVGALIECSPR